MQIVTESTLSIAHNRKVLRRPCRDILSLILLNEVLDTTVPQQTSADETDVPVTPNRAKHGAGKQVDVYEPKPTNV